MNRGYMVDTNIFNAIAKGQLQLSSFLFRPLFTTSIQRTELEATTDPRQRTLLLGAFAELPSQKVHTSSAVWDVTTWDESKWGSEDQNKFVEDFAEQVRIKDEASRKHARDPLRNSLRDALIALTAREHQLILLTGDKNLHAVAAQHKVSSQLVKWPI